MDFIRGYGTDSLAYVDKEYDEPYMRSIVNNLILEEMKLHPNTKEARRATLNRMDDATAHLPSIRTTDGGALCFGNSTALQVAYQQAANRVAAAPAPAPSSSSSSSSGIRTSLPAPVPASGDALFRHSVASLSAPRDALAKDLQAWRRVISMAKVQHEYNANHLMNLEVQQEMMAQKQQQRQGQGDEEGQTVNVVGDIWLAYNKAVETSVEGHCDAQTARTKRALDEVNRTRYVEQTAAGAELAKYAKRRKAAEENCAGIVDALHAMGAALPPPPTQAQAQGEVDAGQV